MANQQHREAKAEKETLKEQAEAEIITSLDSTDNLEVDIGVAQKWIKEVFQGVMEASSSSNVEPQPPEPIQLPRKTAAAILIKVMDILAFNFEFQDSGFYYLNDLGIALDIDPSDIRKIVEMKLDHLRNDFTRLMLNELNQKQLNWCALIILKTILADGRVHPSEKVYFSVIERLIEGSRKTLLELKDVADKIDKIPPLEIDTRVKKMLLKHIVAIAMFDGEYVGLEAKFIKETSKALHVEESELETVIQPMASIFMVIQSLFPLVKT